MVHDLFSNINSVLSKKRSKWSKEMRAWVKKMKLTDYRKKYELVRPGAAPCREDLTHVHVVVGGGERQPSLYTMFTSLCTLCTRCSHLSSASM